jgi:hypothetical protein
MPRRPGPATLLRSGVDGMKGGVAPGAASHLNGCQGGSRSYLFEVSRQYLKPDFISEMIFRTILLRP